jgi:hypothetical protein
MKRVTPIVRHSRRARRPQVGKQRPRAEERRYPETPAPDLTGAPVSTAQGRFSVSV